MSTKIYNGIRFTTSNLISLHRKIAKFQAELEPLALKKLTKVMATIAAESYDDLLIKREKPETFKGKYIIGYARDIVDKRNKEVQQTRRRDPAIDMDFNVCVMPCGRSLLGIIYTEHDDFTEKFMKMCPAEEYAYWNNTDRPDNLTATEWHKRKKDWDKALETYGIPAMNGYTINCLRDFLPWLIDNEDILKAIPSYAYRTKRIATDFTVSALCKKLKIDKVKEYGKIVMTYSEVCDGKHKALYEKQLRKVKNILPKRITKVELMKWR